MRQRRLTCGCVHGPAGDQTSLDELVRVPSHDLPILACSGLSLVSVDDQVSRSAETNRDDRHGIGVSSHVSLAQAERVGRGGMIRLTSCPSPIPACS